MSTPLFHETQYFGIAILLAFFALALVLRIIFRMPVFWNRRLVTVVRSVATAIFLFAFLLFSTTRLETSIFADRIEYGFNSVFYHGRQEVILLDKISRMRIAERQEMSWGIREDGPNEICYAAQGNQVLDVALKDGSIVRIGTGKAAELGVLLKNSLAPKL